MVGSPSGQLKQWALESSPHTRGDGPKPPQNVARDSIVVPTGVGMVRSADFEQSVGHDSLGKVKALRRCISPPLLNAFESLAYVSLPKTQF